MQRSKEEIYLLLLGQKVRDRVAGLMARENKGDQGGAGEDSEAAGRAIREG